MKQLRKSVIISILVAIIPLCIFVYPIETAHAGGVAQWLLLKKELVLDPLTRVLANMVFRKMSSGVLENIVTGGVKNSPLWITDYMNWRMTNTDLGSKLGWMNISLAAYGSETSYEPTWCKYLTPVIGQIFGARKLTESEAEIASPDRRRIDADLPFNLMTQCTLPETIVMPDGTAKAFSIDDFKKDFSNGGWEAAEALLAPENNFFSVLLQSREYLAKIKDESKQASIDEGVAGSGFIGKRVTDSLLDTIVTPGKVSAEAAAGVITKEFDWVTGTDEIGELVTVAMGIVINRLKNLCGGNELCSGVITDVTDAALQTADDKILQNQADGIRQQGQGSAAGAQTANNQKCDSQCEAMARISCNNPTTTGNPNAYNICVGEETRKCQRDQCVTSQQPPSFDEQMQNLENGQ
ncbi:MAG: hypothetical protein CEN90_504 [Parcubacteria group bacterium Licking1014_17]|nr:MAG: hypothetical protein CEN90_504 [Parcubacteria group bacterium Licking1014_17]